MVYRKKVICKACHFRSKEVAKHVQVIVTNVYDAFVGLSTSLNVLPFIVMYSELMYLRQLSVMYTKSPRNDGTFSKLFECHSYHYIYKLVVVKDSTIL